MKRVEPQRQTMVGIGTKFPVVKTRLSLIVSPSFASWIVSVACSSISAYRPKPHRLSCRGFQESISSLSQLLVGDSTARRGVNEAVQPDQRMMLYVALVQPEGELVNVAPKMLFARVMIHAVESALHHGPHALNAVRVHRAASEHARAMVHAAMLEQKLVKAAEGFVFVSVEGRADFDVIEDRLLNGAKIVALNRERFGVAAALAHSQNGDFANGTTALFQLFVLVLVALFAAYECLVYFDKAAQLLNVFAARLAQALQHEPSRLLGYANLFAQLQGTDALAGRDKEIHRVNPFVQRNVRAAKDRASSNSKLELRASVTRIESVFAGGDSFAASALRTLDPVRPQTAFKIEPRCGFIGKQLEQFEGGYCAFHRLILLENGGAVKYIIPFHWSLKESD